MAKSVFDIPVSEMPHVAAGQPIRAKDFNTVADAVERIQKGVKPPQQVFSDPIAKAIAAGADVQLFQLSDFATNTYLPCVQVTGEDAGSTVNVAKPHDLRGVTAPNTNGYFINGALWTCSGYTQAGNRRTATSGTNNEQQVITKTYEPGDFIVAIRVGDGVTEVSQAPDWYDLNVMGRNWARAFGT